MAQLFLVVLRVGGHGDFAPGTDAAFEDFLHEEFSGAFLVAVFVGDVGVAGADGFDLGLVAGKADGFGEEGVAGVFFGDAGEAGVGASVGVRGKFVGRVADFLQLAVIAVVPSGAVLEDIHRSVGAEFDVGGVDEFFAEQPVFLPSDAAFLIELGELHAAVVPVVGDEAAVEFLGQLDGGGVEVVIVVDGAGAVAGAGLEPEGDAGGGEGFEAGVEAGFILGGGGDEFVAELLLFEVVGGVGLVVGDEVGPAVVASSGGLVDLAVATGAAVAVLASVGTDLAPVEDIGALIDADAPGVAAAHGVDLGFGVAGAGGEEVALGDLVLAVVGGADAEDFAAEVVGVSGGPLGVLMFEFLDLVQGRIAGGLEGVGVVAEGEEEVAFGIEGEGAAFVADAVFATLRDMEEDFFVGEGAFLEGEAGETVFLRAGWGVDDVDPAVLHEVGIGGDAEESGLAGFFTGFDGDVELLDDFRFTGFWGVPLQSSGPFDDEDVFGGEDGDFHGVNEAFDEGVDLEVTIVGDLGADEGGGEEGEGEGEFHGCLGKVW